MNTQEINKPDNRKRWILLSGTVLVILLLVGIIGGDENNSATVQTNQITNRCLEVPADTLEWVQSGMTQQDITLENAKAVKSNDFEKVYFISADLKGSGLDDSTNIATFATNNLKDGSNGGRMVLSINTVAKEFTDWFHGDRDGAQFYVTMSADGAQASQNCALE